MGASQAVKNLLEFFLIRLARHTDALAQRARRSYVIDGVDIPRDAKQVLDLLRENLYGRLTIADVAAGVGKSESAVKQLFARHFKLGIMHYYNSLKISEAKKLIREGGYNFTEISDLLAFESPQYFSKTFKKFTGKTPREYRESIIR